VNMLHRTRMLRFVGLKCAELFDVFVNVSFLRSKPKTYRTIVRRMRFEAFSALVWNICMTLAILVMLIYLGIFIHREVSFAEVWEVFYLGLITGVRVFTSVFICSLIWVPIGVWIGLRSRVAEFVQPIAQFLAAFPANLVYPLFVVMIIKYHLNVNVWVTPLMVLGAQWYILFNVIAGASQIPKDLLQAADNFGVSYWLRWRRLLLPGIFPYFITGAITAVGGAWNASIVAEVVVWGDKKLVATGLGAYISQYTVAGNFLHIALGIGMMCVLVLVFNRLVWRPLYVLAETRYMLD
jgi:NitT/TauT family transport system permease protein